jgi:hypothetical protein
MNTGESSSAENLRNTMDWVFTRLRTQAEKIGMPFDESDEYRLRQPGSSVADEDFEQVAETHNVTVQLLRGAIGADMQAAGIGADEDSAPMPPEWIHHMDVVQTHAPEWIMNMAINSAIYGNPLDPEEVASAQAHDSALRVARRAKGTKNMGIGFGIAVLGLVVTAVSYSMAGAGGTYFFFWGAILFGAIQGFIGVYEYIRA